MQIKNWKRWLKRQLGMTLPAKPTVKAAAALSTSGKRDASRTDNEHQMADTKLRETNKKLRDTNEKLREANEKMRANAVRSNEARDRLRDQVAAAELNAAVMKDAAANERDFRLVELRSAIKRLTAVTEVTSGLGHSAASLTADLQTWLSEAQAAEKRLTSEFGTNFATNDYPRIRLSFQLGEASDEATIQRRADLLEVMPTALNSTRVLAALVLPKYESYAGYLATIKAQTQNAMALRQLRKAEQAGFYCKPIHRLNYVPDMHDVNHSKGERQGGAMREPYNFSIEQLGGVPHTILPPETPRDPRNHDYWWGVFEKAPGHCQADGIQTDEKLVGYILLERYGNFARYRHILGHGDYLNKGVVFFLHFQVVRWIYETMPDLHYIIYAGWTDLPNQQDSRPGLTRWKKAALFEPVYAMEELSLPREKMLDWIRSKTGGREFPTHVLENAKSAAAFYTAALMGVRDIIHLNDHQIPDVTLVDLDAEKIEEMKKVYPSGWDYVVDDAHKVMKRFREEGRKFDVLVLDPWTHRQRVDMEQLGTLLDITNRHIVISLSANSYFRQSSISPDSPDALLEHLQGLDDRVATVDVQLCTNLDGGLYWVTIGKGKSAD